MRKCCTQQHAKQKKKKKQNGTKSIKAMKQEQDEQNKCDWLKITVLNRILIIY